MPRLKYKRKRGNNFKCIVCRTHFPAAHELQADDAVDPVTALYLPALHEVQELCPVEAWYLIEQRGVNLVTSQADEWHLKTYFPDGHELHAVDTVEPVTELYLPATQEVHEVCPVEAW
jgi:hypothetical protein